MKGLLTHLNFNAKNSIHIFYFSSRIFSIWEGVKLFALLDRKRYKYRLCILRLPKAN